jgi:prevent-host-death family protein
MEKLISAAEANRRFSQVLRDVGEGEQYVVTSHGRPVARIAPVGQKRRARSRTKQRLLKRLRSQKTVMIGRWQREELYE